ncbi:MAG TPA: hypothetical protein VF316_16585 [Polyangiaceae bacterium]
MQTKDIQFDQDTEVAERTFYKNAPTAVQGAGTWHSFWKATGLPGAGVDPSSAQRAFSSDAFPINAPAAAILFPKLSTGGIVLPAKQRGGGLRYLQSFGIMCSQVGSIMLYDRVTDVDGLALDSVSAQTTCATLAANLVQRYANEGALEAAKLEAWVELTVATSVAAPTLQAHLYTNQDGVSGRVGVATAVPATAVVAGSMLPIALQGDDCGVQSVQGVTVGGTGSTAAAKANIVILKTLLIIPIPTANVWVQVDPAILAKVGRIKDGAVLALAQMNASGTTPAKLQGKALFSYN